MQQFAYLASVLIFKRKNAQTTVPGLVDLFQATVDWYALWPLYAAVLIGVYWHSLPTRVKNETQFHLRPSLQSWGKSLQPIYCNLASLMDPCFFLFYFILYCNIQKRNKTTVCSRAALTSVQISINFFDCSLFLPAGLSLLSAFYQPCSSVWPSELFITHARYAVQCGLHNSDRIIILR